MDSIPSEYKALGLVVFSNIYLFIINDIILTTFRIIFSTSLHNYYLLIGTWKTKSCKTNLKYNQTGGHTKIHLI